MSFEEGAWLAGDGGERDGVGKGGAMVGEVDDLRFIVLDVDFHIELSEFIIDWLL